LKRPFWSLAHFLQFEGVQIRWVADVLLTAVSSHRAETTHETPRE